VVRPAGKRKVVAHLIEAHKLSERRACRLVNLNLSTWQYKRRRQERPGLRARVRALAYERRRFGYRRIHALLRREGWRVNHKAVHHIYVEEGLQVRKRTRKRIGRANVGGWINLGLRTSASRWTSSTTCWPRAKGSAP
jgi:putative transposase